jgi:hypothetical protein
MSVETEQTTPSPYERKAKYIKSYLANKYDTDEAFRTKYNKQRATNQFIKYNADAEYRNKVLERQRNAYQAKKAINEANKRNQTLIPSQADEAGLP